MITDVGEEDDVHPQRKDSVGARLALAARALAYSERIESSGPVFITMDVAGNKGFARLRSRSADARGPVKPGIAVYSRRITGDRP